MGQLSYLSFSVCLNLRARQNLEAYGKKNPDGFDIGPSHVANQNHLL